jgi:hypothetical protein
MKHYLVIHIAMNGEVFRNDIEVGSISKEDYYERRNEETKVIQHHPKDGKSSIDIFHHYRCDSPEEMVWLINHKG